MSRYTGSDYRGPRDRSRSPPRFTDRRGSTANIFDGRPAPPPRTSSDAPRGPRSQFDDPPRPAPGPATASTGTSRPAYSSLRDAPPLGSNNDRGRPFRERDYDRRDRPPSPRERSPPRTFKDPRDYPPRELDTVRARRNSRDGPLSAGSTYSDSSHFSSSQSFRGGFARGRGRGDFEFRGGRGGRRADERDFFRRDRSPPRWSGRDLSRDDRDTERREERRFERREDRWPPDRNDREWDVDRGRRDPIANRGEPRQSGDSAATTPTHYQHSPASAINPDRLAIIEASTNDPPARRASLSAATTQAPQRRDVPETPAYLNGRAETTANRYKQRGSSPPTQAPPVPAFTLSFGGNPAPAAQRTSIDSKAGDDPSIPQQEQPDVSAEAPATHKDPPSAPKAHFTEPPPTAPKALRAPDADSASAHPGRLQGVRSLEALNGPAPPASTNPAAGAVPSASPAQSVQSLPGNATSPNSQHAFVAPTGPRASRTQPGQASVSPRVPFESPRPDQTAFSAIARGQTPPPTAPSGPRNRSFSVSPKVATTSIPTAPKADRARPAPSAAPPTAPSRPGERASNSGTPWGPPTAPRNQWNQWHRPGIPAFPRDKTVPAKRDFTGEEKDASGYARRAELDADKRIKSEQGSRPGTSHRTSADDNMDLDSEAMRSKQNSLSGHSAAQSFFGKPSIESPEDQTMSDVVDEPISSSEDEDLNPEEDAALFNAKFERQKRALEAQLVDLSSREFRATTPLESISRLARISETDLQRLRENQGMNVDAVAPTVGRRRQQAAATSSSSSEDGPDVLTPKGEDNNDVVIRTNEDPMMAIRRLRQRTPEVISLPFLAKDPAPFEQDDVFKDMLRRQEQTRPIALAAIEQDVSDEDDLLSEFEMEFRELYRGWRFECEDLDREKERIELLERQQSLEPGPELDIPTAPAISEREERGRRLHKFSSEYEIELVLKQSEETARIEQERQDRESKRLQADMEKEALLPDQQTAEEVKRTMYINMNRRRDATTLTLVFCYIPPPDTFTDEEQRIFIAAFKETPKKWGEIASLLPGRTYKHCIHHYYANKWDNRFRDSRTKRLKAGVGRGRGRGGKSVRGRGAGLMADLGKTDELIPAVSDSGRPKRAAAPTTFGEREQTENKAAIGISPAKKPGPSSKQEAPGDEKQPKRRKGLGEKPGRKTKATPGLSAIAAAPSAASPSKPIMDPARAQHLEDASLLASFQSGRHGIYATEGYPHETFMPPPPVDDSQRAKAMPPSSSRPAASSYWSVPEQTDFVKYIAHFGTDFGAIAAHMGTKTQTMIKNHYQRQIDGKPELEQAARVADQRRQDGHDLGAPPTPTPIVKRKYDNPQPPPRTLQATKEALDAEERAAARAQPANLPGSPSLFPPQPRFTGGVQTPSLTAQRVVASPVPAAVTPAVSQAQPVLVPGHPVPHQHQQAHPLSTRLAFLNDTPRPESRPGTQTSSSFRTAHEGLATFSSRGQSQPGRPNAADPKYIMGLVAQQEQALRVQQEHSQQERLEQGFQRQHPLGHGSNHGSPAVKPMHEPPPQAPRVGSDRPAFKEERRPSPPRTFSSTSGSSRQLLGAPMFSSLGSAPFASGMTDRGPFAHSPPRREDSRPSSFSQAPSQPPSSAPTPAPEPPKRSNLLSILNSDPEEPAPKREPPPSATPRTASPASGGFGHSGAPSSLSGVSHGARDMFGQHSMAPSRFPPSSAFGTPRETSSSSGFKHESSIGASSSQSTKVDWATSALALNTSQQNPNAPSAMDRDRPFFPGNHRSSAFGAMNQPARGNPSPPPNQPVAHSRNASLTSAARDARATMQAQQQPPPTPHQTILQPSPYAQKPSTPSYSQAPPLQAQNQSHHTHNASIGGTYSPFHHRAPSRDEHRRVAEEHAFAPQREREREQEWRRRQDAIEMERARDRDRDREYRAARQREQEQRQQALPIGYPTSHAQPLPPQQALQQPYGTPAFASSRLGLAQPRESEASYRAAEEEQRRMHDERWRREEEHRRRQQHEEAIYQQQQQQQQRRTPLGPGGYGAPPPPPGSQPRR